MRPRGRRAGLLALEFKFQLGAGGLGGVFAVEGGGGVVRLGLGLLLALGEGAGRGGGGGGGGGAVGEVGGGFDAAGGVEAAGGLGVGGRGLRLMLGVRVVVMVVVEVGLQVGEGAGGGAAGGGAAAVAEEAADAVRGHAGLGVRLRDRVRTVGASRGGSGGDGRHLGS